VGALSDLPAAVIFDCDGTLIDSEPLARVAWERVLAPHGYTPTGADMEAVTGLPYPVVHAFFAERAALPAPEALLETLSRELFALFDAHLEPFADAVATVRALREHGVPLAVASSSQRRRLDLALAHVGLDGAFAVSVAGDEMERGKPAPDMFLEAARRLGVPPAGCVVVEDSAAGTAAGLAAGMRVLAVVRVPGGAVALADAHRVTDALTLDAVRAAAEG